MIIVGKLFVCPHCGDCVEFIEPVGASETHPDDYRCGCGAVLEAVELGSEVDRQLDAGARFARILAVPS